ncbi:MAG TPA: hypothetical protein VMV86_00720 [Methanosarcinales archaeon]|nr:hypothetical protein [Methanosarcinales archaeon]
MNIIIIAQVLATVLMLAVIYMYISYAARNFKLKRLFKKEYIRVINRRTARKLYPFVPKPNSSKYIRTRRFLSAIGWNISVEGIYLCKWGMSAVMVFMMVTIQTTNTSIALKEIVQDVNYNHNIIETLKSETEQNIVLEKQLYYIVDENLEKSEKIFNKQNKQVYIDYIESLISDKRLEIGEELRSTAQRMYYKVLETRTIRNEIIPYMYIILFAALIYNMPDILGQIKRKLIEDKKNWEILNCMIVFSTFGRMSPYSVLNILEHMVIATEVYKPLLEALIEGLKKGGRQEEAFDAALEAVDRDELYELIETMKLSKVTGLINAVDDVDESITNTIKWIEIENIKRRRAKMLYAMSAMAIVMGLGCIYFAYGLTVISNPANMLVK